MDQSHDQLSRAYSSAADMINTGTAGGREDFTARPVSRGQLGARADALGEVSSALLTALAVLRDGSESTHPGLTEQLQAAVSAAYSVGTELRTIQQLLADPRPLEEDDE